MDLKEFITNAIADISEGVKDADKKIQEIGGLVNPGAHEKESGEFINARTTLDFDIAISAGNEKSGNAQGTARIWVVEASAGGKKISKDEIVSRLSFSVDIVLPPPDDQKARVGKVKRPASK